MGPMTIFSSAQRALQILEIVELVLSFVDRKTAKHCCRVCRLWKEPAQNAHWKYLEDEEFGLELLPYLLPARKRCRVCPPYEPLIHFHQHPNYSDWARFYNCSRRVRHLELYPLVLRMEEVISKDTFEILAVSRPPGVRSIVPRLRSLVIKMYGFGSLSSAIRGDLFFHEGIRDVTLDLSGFEMIEPMNEDGDIEEDVDVHWPRRLLSEIAGFSPNITTLHVDMEDPVLGPMREDLCNLLVALRRLEAYSCTFHESITTRIVIALKNHTWLRTVTVGRPYNANSPWERALAFDEDVSYPALESLQFCSSLAETPLLFEWSSGQPLQFPYLTRLWIRIIISRSNSVTLHSFCSNISWHCPNLEFLRIAFDQRGVFPPVVQITGKTLWPLQFLKYLKSLQISPVQGLEITDAELAELVANLPRLNVLRIGECPPDDDDEDVDDNPMFHPSKFTLNLFALLSTIPNQLEEISLCVNASNLIGIRHPIGPHLQSLEEIWFGMSPIASCAACIEEIARFFAHILHPDCAIRSDETNEDLFNRWESLRVHIDDLHRCSCSECTRRSSFIPLHWHGAPRPVPWINVN